MEVYKTEPTFVKIHMSDNTGDAVRFIPMLCLDAVINAVEETFYAIVAVPKAKKPRAKRRTKAEIEAAKQDDPPAPEGTISSEPVEKKHRRIFP